MKNLNIPNYENCDFVAEKFSDPTLKAMVKWSKYPNMLAITSEYGNIVNFSFNFVSKEDALAVIKALDVSKAIQENISVKIIETNYYLNKLLENGKFHNFFKLANITPVFQKRCTYIKK